MRWLRPGRVEAPAGDGNFSPAIAEKTPAIDAIAIKFGFLPSTERLYRRRRSVAQPG